MMSVSIRRFSMRGHYEKKSSHLQRDGKGLTTPFLKDLVKALPYEISLLILQFEIASSKRQAKRLIELSSVCSTWRTFIVSSPIFWRHFDFSGDTALKSLALWETRAKGDRSSTNQKDVQGFIGVSIDCWSGPEVESFYNTFQGWAGLQELTISLHWNTPFLAPHVLSLLHLQELEIRCLSETNPAHSRMTLEGMDTSRLRVLKLHHPKNLSLLLLSSQSWPELRTLEITGCFHHEKQLAALESFFSHNPAIEHLALLNEQPVALGFGESAWDSVIASDNYHPPITRLTNIRSLSIRMPYGVSEPWLQMLVPPSLELLDVNVLHISVLASFFHSTTLPRPQSPTQSDTQFGTALRRKIVDLRVSVPGFSESELVHLSKVLPNVETIEIKSGSKSGMNFILHPQPPTMKRIREEDLVEYQRGFMNLKKLSVDDGKGRDMMVGDVRARSSLVVI